MKVVLIINKPKVSIIVLIYKVEQYLVQCLESILSQTYSNIEIILSVGVDNSDNCELICDQYAKKDNRIVLVSSKPSGIAAARNLAMEKITGDFLVFVDGDDWIEPDMVDAMLQNMIKYNTQISICGVLTEYKDHFDCSTQQPLLVMDTKEAFRNLLYMKNYGLSLWDKMYDVKMIKGIRFPLTKEAEDRYWLYQIMGNADKIVYDSAAKYHFRYRLSSCSRNDINARISMDADKKMCKYIIDRFPELMNECQYFMFYSNYTTVYSDLLYSKFSYKQDNDLLVDMKKEAKFIIRDKVVGFNSKLHAILILINRFLIIRFMLWRIKVYKNLKIQAYD